MQSIDYEGIKSQLLIMIRRLALEDFKREWKNQLDIKDMKDPKD
ncbi:hypothetical protein [Pantoea agglomerans]|nr:hypothetical protein [Pantoea agglomerans]